MQIRPSHKGDSHFAKVNYSPLFWPKMSAVNKFRLLLFGKIALDSGILKVQLSLNYATDFRG
jgi:hypothetical protein